MLKIMLFFFALFTVSVLIVVMLIKKISVVVDMWYLSSVLYFIGKTRNKFEDKIP